MGTKDTGQWISSGCLRLTSLRYVRMGSGDRRMIQRRDGSDVGFVCGRCKNHLRPSKSERDSGVLPQDKMQEMADRIDAQRAQDSGRAATTAT